MSNTNISGTFHLDTKENSISKKNMVVDNGIKQVFNWFRLSDYAQPVKHHAGEKIFSKYDIERINWQNSVVSIDNNSDENMKNSFSNIQAIVDGWDNTSLSSNYSTSNERSIKITFNDKENNPAEIDIKGIALYGKRTSNYSNSTISYCGKIILKRKIKDGVIAKKIFEVPVLLSPCYMNSDKLSFSQDSEYWAGGKYYVYFTFDEMFDNKKSWKFYQISTNEETSETTEEEITQESIESELTDFQESVTFENPYLEKIYEVEFIDRYYSYIQINEADIYTYRKNCFFNSPSYFKIGNGTTEVTATDNDLESIITEIPVDEIYETETGIRYVGYIPESDYDNIQISEVGIFFEQDGTKNMFAKTVLTEPFIVPEGSFVRIMYDLEVE